MRTLGATLTAVNRGSVTIELPFHEALGQQDGFAHAGAIASIADSACGYAAMTRMEPGDRVLSIEFKVNMLKPATGDRFSAEARVIRAGRSIIVCEASVHAITGTERVHVAQMQGTMMSLRSDGTAGRS